MLLTWEGDNFIIVTDDDEFPLHQRRIGERDRDTGLKSSRLMKSEIIQADFYARVGMNRVKRTF